MKLHNSSVSQPVCSTLDKAPPTSHGFTAAIEHAERHDVTRPFTAGWTYTATSRALTTSPAPANNGAATRTARGDAADHPGTILGGGTWQAEERSSLPAGGGARAALFSARRSGSGRPTPEPTAAPTHHDPHREIDTLMTAAAQRAGAAAAANAATEALRRRARPTSPSMAAHGPGAGAGSAPHMPPEVTTYQMAFHLAQMHPELYAQALAAGKVGEEEGGGCLPTRAALGWGADLHTNNVGKMCMWGEGGN